MAEYELCEQPLNGEEKVKDVCALSCGTCEATVGIYTVLENKNDMLLNISWRDHCLIV
jgi:hypothetical protein